MTLFKLTSSQHFGYNSIYKDIFPMAIADSWLLKRQIAQTTLQRICISTEIITLVTQKAEKQTLKKEFTKYEDKWISSWHLVQSQVLTWSTISSRFQLH